MKDIEIYDCYHYTLEGVLSWLDETKSTMDSLGYVYSSEVKLGDIYSGFIYVFSSEYDKVIYELCKEPINAN